VLSGRECWYGIGRRSGANEEMRSVFAWTCSSFAKRSPLTSTFQWQSGAIFVAALQLEFRIIQVRVFAFSFHSMIFFSWPAYWRPCKVPSDEPLGSVTVRRPDFEFSFPFSRVDVVPFSLEQFELTDRVTSLGVAMSAFWFRIFVVVFVAI